MDARPHEQAQSSARASPRKARRARCLGPGQPARHGHGRPALSAAPTTPRVPCCPAANAPPRGRFCPAVPPEPHHGCSTNPPQPTWTPNPWLGWTFPSTAIPGHGHRRHPRPLFPGQRGPGWIPGTHRGRGQFFPLPGRATTRPGSTEAGTLARQGGKGREPTGSRHSPGSSNGCACPRADVTPRSKAPHARPTNPWPSRKGNGMGQGSRNLHSARTAPGQKTSNRVRGAWQGLRRPGLLLEKPDPSPCRRGANWSASSPQRRR